MVGYFAALFAGPARPNVMDDPLTTFPNVVSDSFTTFPNVLDESSSTLYRAR